MTPLEIPTIPKRGSSSPSLGPDPIVPETLTSPQLHALFDILTHYETYTEVELLKKPDTIAGYGYPFVLRQNPDGTPAYATESTAPLLAALLRSIVLPIPGVRDLPSDFWHVRFQGILTNLSAADLSESYDKGVLGVRKTLATAASAIHESVSRGILGGVPKGPKRDLNRYYDRSKASELQQAWEDVMHELAYGNLIDELFDTATASSNIDDQPRAVVAAIDYVIIHVATFMHHVFVLSSQGPYMLKLVEMVHKMMPYSAIRQVLRIGNVATMLNGLTRLLLAKMGMGSLSNWMGITKNADDGMNLLQWIVSGVLSADTAEFRKSVDSIEKAKDSPPKEALAKIKEYVLKSREFHERTRNASSKSSTSITAIILGDSVNSLSEKQHLHCLEYLSATLAVRDREEISKAFCRNKPDLFTQAVRDIVASFEPIIRSVHRKVDLREHISSIENVLSDFINTSKPKRSPVPISNTQTDETDGQSTSVETRAPSIEDYVGQLTRARQLVYNLLHDVPSKCPEVADQFREYAKQVSKVFSSGQAIPQFQPQTGRLQRSSSSQSFVSAVEEIKLELTTKNGDSGEIKADLSTETRNGGNSNTADNDNTEQWRQRKGAAGALSRNLQSLFSALPRETRAQVISVVGAHAVYLAQLEELSLRRMQNILDDMKPEPHPEDIHDNNNTTNTSTPNETTSTQNASRDSSTSSNSSSSTSSDSDTTEQPDQPATPSPPPITRTNTTGIITYRGSSIAGPGIYLARWQQLLDETLITPSTPGGTIRRGKDVKHAHTRGKTASAATKGAWDPEALTKLVEGAIPDAPEGERTVITALGGKFREVVGDLLRGGRWEGGV